MTGCDGNIGIKGFGRGCSTGGADGAAGNGAGNGADGGADGGDDAATPSPATGGTSGNDVPHRSQNRPLTILRPQFGQVIFI